MELTKDTPTTEAEHTHPSDPHQTGSGSAASPGGANAPQQSVSDLSQGGQAYPGPRDGGEEAKKGEGSDGAA